MTRLIDKDMLIEILGEMQGLCDTKAALIQNSKIWQQVKDLPTVDAVPVIRCKDCKYYNPQQHYCEGIGNWFGYDGEWSDNGYCYKAERKEE